MRKYLFLSVVFVAALSGCANRIGDFTMVSSKNIDMTRMAEFKRNNVRVKAEDSVPVLLGIPFGLPNMKTALDRAIEQSPGAVALTDAVVIQRELRFVLLGRMGFEVEGNPLIDPKLQRSLLQDDPK